MGGEVGHIMVDPITVEGVVAGIEIAEKTAKVLDKLYTYFKTRSYGNVGVFLTVKMVFKEALEFDVWFSKINSVLSSKGMKKDISGEKIVDEALRILRITGDLVGFPQIDDLHEGLIEVEGSVEEEDSEPVFYVRSGVIEAKPYCSEKSCLSKAVDVLVDVVSEFEGQISKARIFIELRFPSMDKASEFYKRVKEALEKNYREPLKERKIIIYSPTPENVVQIVISPYNVRAVDIIESEMFRWKGLGQFLKRKISSK